ncbi:Hca operon transcriptional activator HcaR [Ralstonia wenshanensis]|jgi:DNA-binding transcriptional LysR family regulator|uniref:LysR family transcriptional regulator n=1 Tax=Ralstonia wenshanensis TaxID=2842456 RepID=UPI0028F5EBA2|nr:LysR family transcriptional regulator [Ralstonia wenshanensis]CAJ0813486.1 Hca operon transcriptional activator HcaR [Ralstonia wenshanensis]
MDLRQLRYFVTVATTENIAQASERLHISASPLSRQIIRLEEALGVVLFERERKRLKLTEAGRRLLTEARALLQQADTLARRIVQPDTSHAQADAQAETRTPLTFAYTQSSLMPGMPAALQRVVTALSTSAPGMRADMLVMAPERIVANVMRGVLHAGLIAGYVPVHDGLDQVSVAYERVTLVVSVNHWLARQNVVDAWQLDNVPIALDTALQDGLFGALTHWCGRHGATPGPLLITPDAASASDLAASGIAVTLQVGQAHTALPPELVRVQLAWDAPQIHTALVYPKVDCHPVVRAVVSALGGTHSQSASAPQSKLLSVPGLGVLTDAGTPVPPAPAPAHIELAPTASCGSTVLVDDHLGFLHSMLA